MLLSCKSPTSNRKEVPALAENQIMAIFQDWKQDSLGCLGKRRKIDRVKVALNQLEIAGKDSLTVVSYLGQPNFHYNYGDTLTIAYFVECGEKGKVSYANFYCHFVNDTLWYFSNPVF